MSLHRYIQHRKLVLCTVGAVGFYLLASGIVTAFLILLCVNHSRLSRDPRPITDRRDLVDRLVLAAAEIYDHIYDWYTDRLDVAILRDNTTSWDKKLISCTRHKKCTVVDHLHLPWCGLYSCDSCDPTIVDCVLDINPSNCWRYVGFQEKEEEEEEEESDTIPSILFGNTDSE